ncbi:MAG: hypothetical protein AAB654_10705 [Acidobacteriota bacterium]|jgi:hypothetical protein
MADNKLELVIEVDVAKGNASIKTFNAGLSGIEEAVSRAGRGASAGIDGITVRMAEGVVPDVITVHWTGWTPRNPPSSVS